MLILVVVTDLKMGVMDFYVTRTVKTHTVEDLRALLQSQARLIHDAFGPLLQGEEYRMIHGPLIRRVQGSGAA
jgi:hypothetical protein